MKRISIVTLVFSLAGTACGGDDDGGGTPGDPPDAAPNVCLADADYGAATLSDVDGLLGVGDVANPIEIIFGGLLNSDAQPDALHVELYSGFGVFADGIVPGTYPLAGDELNYQTCGICVRLLTDIDPETLRPSDDGYLATGGEVVITSAAPTVTGMISGVTFEHVTLDPEADFRSAPHPDGCTSGLDSVSFDIELATEL